MKQRKARSDTRSSQGASAHANHEIVTLAVFLLGGNSSHVDTEDVAIKSNELAPGRFTWRKYPEQVNLELIRVYLSDAKKAAKGKYLMGSGTDGWLLTEAGYSFAKNALKRMRNLDLSGKAIGAKEKKWRRSERARLLSSDVFKKFVTDGPDAISPHEAATFFRIDDYVVGQLKEEKLTRILNAFGDDKKIGPAVQHFARIVRSTSNARIDS